MAKLIINSTISTPGERYMYWDIKHLYLGAPMSRYEYIKLPIDILPEEIFQEYNLTILEQNGYV